MAARALPITGRTEQEAKPGLIPGRMTLGWREDRAAAKGLPLPGAHKWQPGALMALAGQRCTTCRGTGMRPSWGRQTRPCACVYRRVFRACVREYDKCCMGATKWQVEYRGWLDSDGRTTSHYGLPREEYICDFELVAKRALTPRQHAIFRLHVLRGVEAKLCWERLRMSRGTFFHDLYRMAETLGWAYSELKPYPLFPAADYFRDKGAKMQVQGEKNPWPWAA